MQRKDHLSDDVIKIFHNAKGSVKNNVEKWVDPNDTQMTKSEGNKYRMEFNFTARPCSRRI